MKQFSKFALCAIGILIISLYNFTAKGQLASNLSISFISTPTLLSGTNLALGSSYRFNNVATNTYAIVTIASATGGASVQILDDNLLTKPEAFSPRVVLPGNSNGMVSFNIAFYNNNTNASVKIDTLAVTAMDIDGSASLHEADALDLGATSLLSYQSSALEIGVTQNGNEYLGTNIAGIEYTGVDTAAKQVMFTVSNKKISQFIYKAGANNQYTDSVSRQKGIYFKAFTYPTINILPLKILSFTANSNEKNITLNWLTQNEINSKHFEVERSYDGANFTNIAFVLDGFENGNKKLYSYKDVDALTQQASNIYYRLKQVDIDGRFTYSQIIAVKKGTNNTAAIQIMPNPFTDHVQIQYTAKQATVATLTIVSTNGKQVHVQKLNLSKGFNNFYATGLNNLSSGLYVATLMINDNIVATQKIIK